jgi:DNA modification methylase
MTELLSTTTLTDGRGLPPASIGHNNPFVIEMVPVSELKLDPDNPRTYSPREFKAAKRVLRRFKLRVPLVIDNNNIVHIGGIILLVASALGYEYLPVLRIDDLTPVECQALSIAYGRLGELGEWDKEKLSALMVRFEAEIPNFELEDLGFDVPAIDMFMLDDNEKLETENALEGEPVSRVGDLWLMHKHRLLCGDACDPKVYEVLMAGVLACAVFTDPPFGCAIDGFVSGKGRHREFVMASGEMSDEELSAFFTRFLAAMKEHLARGAVIYLVIDWRSLHFLLEAARPIYGKLVNLAVWTKDRAGMGSFLRSQHELILIFKMPGKMRNNIELGKHGRHRSNVWSYPSAKTASTGSDEGNILAHHPTPKPVRMIADALLDTTRRGDIVLDAFLGSGTTLIAAEKVGRVCYALDLDPLYVDLAVRRWQAWTGEKAIHAETGLSFDEMAALRDAE